MKIVIVSVLVDIRITRASDYGPFPGLSSPSVD